MTNEERDLIAQFIARVGGGPSAQSGSFLGSGSVPQTQPALPPIDREADAFIAQQMRQYPEAPYRITQTAIVQEAAFAEAQNRIKRLEWELEQTKQAVQHAAAQPPQQQRGFLSNLFGGGAAAQPQRPGGAFGQQQPQWNGGGYQPSSPPPQPQYPPNYQPGMFQRGGGSGFLGSALTTAAGVAGGMVVGNALMGAFSGNHGAAEAASPWGGAAGGGGSPFDNAGVVPTDPAAGYGTDTSANDPFGGGGMTKDASDQSGWDQGGGFGGADQGGGGGFDGGGFDSGGGFDGGGFDNNG